jgi:hypothetical protein
MSDEEPVEHGHFVYLYRDIEGRPVYVGRGGEISRAEGHALGTHNAGLAQLIAKGVYTLEIAGPYGSIETSAAVEAALISALRVSATPRLTNIAPGDGPKFVPLGVPLALAERGAAQPLSIEEVGRMTGGILLVRQSSSGVFSLDASRAKYDPAHLDEGVVRDNILRYWKLAPLLRLWKKTGEWPLVIAGLAGPTKRRYVTGALRTVWDDNFPLHHKRGFEVGGTGDLDAFDLRGRRVENARFGQFNIAHHIWVDGKGVVRYMVPSGGGSGLSDADRMLAALT